MPAVTLHSIPRFMQNFQKTAFSFLQNSTKKNVSKEYCILHHSNEMCFLPSFGYQFFLLGNVEEFLQKLDHLFSKHQHVDCPHTLLKYQVKEKNVFKRNQVLDNVEKVVCFNQGITGMDRMPSIEKKRLLMKKYSKLVLNSFQETKSTETSGLVCAEKIGQVWRTKDKTDLLENPNCSIDGYGSYSSNLVTFEKNFDNLTIVCNSERIQHAEC